MKKMKKALALLLVAAISLGMTGCTDNAGEEEESTTKAVSEMGEFTLDIDADATGLDESYHISQTLYGLFLEDINYAIDAGMYSELIKNRSFEYGALANNGSKHGWAASTADQLTFEVIDGTNDKSYLNENNPQYAKLVNKSSNLAGIYNSGYLDGLVCSKDQQFDFSIYLRAVDGYNGKVTIRLTDAKCEKIYAEETISDLKNEWWKYELSLTANEEVNSQLKFAVMIDKGSVEMDMVSLFPKDTYKDRQGGLREDIVQMLEELSPKFLRFPGGCVVEGKSLESAYSWKDSIGNGLEFEINGEKTIGDVAVRSQGINIWADLGKASANPYYMTYGVGFYEYFQLCEDIGAEPMPVVNAGMSCMIQGSSNFVPADVLAIDSDEFKQYVQDALDLVEFCKGDASTKWGAVRIAMGHEEEFPLTYVAIGNEQWSNEYYKRYEEFKAAFEKAAKDNPDLYGDIELVVANGPNSDSKEAWTKVNTKGSDYAGLVDEHFYETPEWLITHTARYDSYKRDSVPVFLGEYAGKANNLKAALGEAAFMTGLERNSDIVKMAAYAPIFANNTVNQWQPDMIWFNNTTVYGSINYYNQKLFATNLGTILLNSTLTGKFSKTTGTISQTVSVDEETGDIIIKIVNPYKQDSNVKINITNAANIETTAKVQRISAETDTVINSRGTPELCTIQESTTEVAESFDFGVPKYSITVLRIHTK